MSALLDLAERCEAATGPDRELDELISAAIQDAVREVQSDGRTAYHSLDGSKWVSIAVGSYTASLDAAMTLVPDGWPKTIHDTDGDKCSVMICSHVEPDDWIEDAVVSISPSYGLAETWPLAICAAALRARAAEQSALNREGGK